MAKKINLNKELEKKIKELLPYLTPEQLQEIHDNPAILVDACVEGFKQACAERGIDYTTTPMYQEELKFRKLQEELQASVEKWEHLNTPEGEELFEMAFRVAWRRNMVSHRAYHVLKYGPHDSFTPAGFKVFMDQYVLRDKRPRFVTKKVAEELIRFNEFYDQNFSLDLFSQLSRKEQLMCYATYIAVRITDEQKQFLSQFIDEHDHLPMFWLITKFYENMDKNDKEARPYVAAREFYGLCSDERKSFEQLQSELGVSRQRVREILYHGFPGGLYGKSKPASCWEPYRALFTAPLLTADNCHYEQIKEQEHLHMDVDCFLRVLGICLPWADLVHSAKNRDDRCWATAIPGAEQFSFDRLVWDIRQEQINKDRTEEKVINLTRICKSKDYWESYPEPVQPNLEALPMIISTAKIILKEMLGIETKGNKIIFPAKRK